VILEEYLDILRVIGASLRQRGIPCRSTPDEPFLIVPGNPGGFDILVSLDPYGDIMQVEFDGRDEVHRLRNA
jgi:hypothetical protein